MTETQPRYEHVNDRIVLNLDRLRGHDVLDALNDRIEMLDHLVADGILMEREDETGAEIARLTATAVEVEAQLSEVREVVS